MLTTDSCTLYLRRGNGFDRFFVPACHWQERQASNVIKSGMQSADSVVVYNIARYDEDTDSYPELPVPTLASGILYTEPIHIQEGDKFKIVAVAVKEGWTSSDAVRSVEGMGENGVIYAEVIQYQVIGELGDDEQLGGTERIRDNGQIEF